MPQGLVALCFLKRGDEVGWLESTQPEFELLEDAHPIAGGKHVLACVAAEKVFTQEVKGCPIYRVFNLGEPVPIPMFIYGGLQLLEADGLPLTTNPDDLEAAALKLRLGATAEWLRTNSAQYVEGMRRGWKPIDGTVYDPGEKD